MDLIYLLANQLFSVRITYVPRNADVCIVDGMFLVQSHVDLPLTFGGEANVTLPRIVRHPNRKECACDTLDIHQLMILPENIIVWHRERQMYLDLNSACLKILLKL